MDMYVCMHAMLLEGRIHSGTHRLRIVFRLSPSPSPAIAALPKLRYGRYSPELRALMVVMLSEGSRVISLSVVVSVLIAPVRRHLRQ